jgi:DNA-binding beta-propeller fold protein YncE
MFFPRAVAVDPFGKFLYVADGETSAFSIATNGTLTQISGSPYSFGPQNILASSLVVDPLARFLWVDHLYVEIDGFSIDSNTGVLSSLGASLASPNPQIALTIGPSTSTIPMAPDPSGKFLYVLTQPGAVAQNFSISGFAIDPTTGKLTLLSSSPLPLPANTTPVTVAITRKPQ